MPHTAQTTAGYTRAHRGLWQLCSALSLDAALVAVVWQQWLHPTGAAAALVLGLSVWLVYTADHWLDVRGLSPSQIHTERHRFTHRHQRLLLPAWGLVLALNLALAITGLGAGQLLAGCILLVLCLGYIASIQLRQRKVPKELIVAVIFACGAAVFQLGAVPWPELAAATCGLLLLAFANCSLIAHREIRTDRQMGFPSLAMHAPSSYTCALAALYTATALGLALSLFAGLHYSALSLCACALLLLEHYGRELPQETFRRIADALLLLPVFFLPMLLGKTPLPY